MDLKDVYYSSKPYTQEEFESIIINAYKYVCEEIETKNKRFQACHDFEPCFICWNIELEGNEFTKWIEENSDLRVINKFNASMDVGVLGSFKKILLSWKMALIYLKFQDAKENAIGNISLMRNASLKEEG